MDRAVVRIARVARNEITRFSQRCDLHSYNDPDLSCLCGISSWFIKQLGKKLGYQINCAVGYFKNDCHAWNVYRGEIIDVTATQFGVKEKIYVTATTNEDYEFGQWYHTEEAFAPWPEEQQPQTFDKVLSTHMDRAYRILTVNYVDIAA